LKKTRNSPVIADIITSLRPKYKATESALTDPLIELCVSGKGEGKEREGWNGEKRERKTGGNSWKKLGEDSE